VYNQLNNKIRFESTSGIMAR